MPINKWYFSTLIKEASVYNKGIEYREPLLPKGLKKQTVEYRTAVK